MYCYFAGEDENSVLLPFYRKQSLGIFILPASRKSVNTTVPALSTGGS